MFFSCSWKRLCVLGLGIAVAGAMQAAVKLPSIFSDHMMLQHADKVPVWGWADPQEAVTVTLGQGKSAPHASTRADANGKWMVRLDLASLPKGPFEMTVKGTNTLKVKDVVLGQVWLASGQSNMSFSLSRSIGAKEEVAAGAGKWVREFRVSRAARSEPQADAGGKWVVAEPGQTGGFSAVAYYFAKTLHKALGQPVAIIHSSWGGTPSEAWTSVEALDTDKELAASVKRKNADVASFAGRKAKFDKDLIGWVKASHTEDAVFEPAANFAAPNVDTSKWVQEKYSDTIKARGLPAHGVIWLRCEVTVPKNVAGKNLAYNLQYGRGFATFYWNGHRISGPESWNARELAKAPGVGKRLQLKIPGDQVKAGKNVLAVRVYAPVESPSGPGWRNQLQGPNGFSVNLNSRPWRARAEKAFTMDAKVAASAPKQPTEPSAAQYLPARLYNGMIAPLVPYSIAGVIWYQGESNASRAFQYRTAFPLLINDWRARWDNPELPFYFCQLANYMAKQDEPGDSTWAELREAQTMTLKLKHSGQAVLIDVGEAGDIHPRNKTTVGERLARLALVNDYGKADVVAVGPTFEEMAVVGGKAYLKFKDTGAGSELEAHPLPKTYVYRSIVNDNSRPLKVLSPGSGLQGFAICGADGKWVWAQAEIETPHSVVVWSPKVKKPVAVRYAWANNPTCNLYNAAGLPAVPFRTDHFKSIALSHY